MKAVVFHATGDIRIEDMPEPRLQQPTDAIVRLTTSAICGTDLHFVRGTMVEPVQNVIQAYEAFDKREPGWIKVASNPMSQAAE